MISAFEYHRPETLEEALQLLSQLGDEAVVYCGGTELIQIAKTGLTSFKHLIDLKAVEQLQGIDVNSGTIRVGAAVTHYEIERSALVRHQLESLASMAAKIGNIRVRCSGSLGGNLAFADPHSDPAVYLLATDATLVIVGATGERAVSVANFCKGAYETVLDHDELILEVRIPLQDNRTSIAHQRFTVTERPIANVACRATMGEGLVLDLGLAVGSVTDIPVRLVEIEESQVGRSREEVLGNIEQIADAASDALALRADSMGSIDYKRNLVSVLTRRAIRDLFEHE